MITAARAEVEVFAAGDADALAIIAANALAVDFEVDGFEQNGVEIDRAILIGDGVEVVFVEDDFVDVADAFGIDELENGVKIEFSDEARAAAVACQFEFCADVGVERDELCMSQKPGVVLNGLERDALVGVVEITGKTFAGDFTARGKSLFVADIIDVDLHSTKPRFDCCEQAQKNAHLGRQEYREAPGWCQAFCPLFGIIGGRIGILRFVC